MTRSLRQSSLRGQSTHHGQTPRRGNSKLILCSAASLAATALSAQSVMAASGTWVQPFGGTYNFETPANWIGGIVPGAPDDIADFSRFNFQGGDINVTLNSNRTLGQMVFGDLDISSDINFNINGPGVLTLASAIAQPILNVGTTSVFGKYAAINSTLAGTSGFNKLGAGLLLLTGTNTYSGATTITAGTVRVTSGVNLGASTVVLNGGTLDLRNDVSTNFGTAVTLGANSNINVNSIPGSGVQSQTQTIGALSFGAAGLGRTLTVTNYQPVTTATPTLDNNFYSLATGVTTLNDNGTLLSNLNGTVALGGVNSTSALPTTLTIGGSNSYAGTITINGPVTQGVGGGNHVHQQSEPRPEWCGSPTPEAPTSPAAALSR